MARSQLLSLILARQHQKVADPWFRLSNFGTLEYFEIGAPKVFIQLQLLIRSTYLFIQPTTNLSSLTIILSYFNANKITFVPQHQVSCSSIGIGAGSRVPGGAQVPPELFLAPPPEPFEPPLTIEKIMH